MRRKSGHPRPPEPKPSIPVPIPENWSAGQARAVYDLCATLQELVWRRYRDVLVDPMLRAQFEADAARHATDERPYRLPFDDDDPPF